MISGRLGREGQVATAGNLTMGSSIKGRHTLLVSPNVSLKTNCPRFSGQNSIQLFDFIGAPGETRTPNLLIRSQTLYPIELRALFRFPRASRRWRQLRGP